MRALIAAGRNVEAIKLERVSTGLGLAEAKDLTVPPGVGFPAWQPGTLLEIISALSQITTMQVFISSVYEDGRSAGDQRHLEIRYRLKKLGLEPAVDSWVAEYEEENPFDQGWRAVVDTCVHALYESDLMIVLLFRRWGTAIEVDKLGASPVSYLEIELFHAALNRIPVLFFQAADFEPEPELAALIRLLQRITSPDQWVVARQAKVEQQVVDLLQAIAKDGRLPARLSQFCDALSDDVSFAAVDSEIESTRLSLLKGFEPSDQSPVSLDRIDLLLSETDALAGSGEGAYVDRLTRLWMALRELAKQPDSALDSKMAERWVRLCELWSSSAAWLRLHGPLRLGVLATLHTRVQLRKAGFIDERLFPFGPFASETYSIGKITERRDWRIRRFQASSRLASTQIALRPRDPSGAYGIRASARMQLAQLGRPWLGFAALRDYRKMLAVREKMGASDSEVGEAMVEGAYAEFAIARRLSLKGRAAVERMRAGVALLDADHPERRAGFVIRAKRKLAEALEQSKLLDEARHQRDDIKALVVRHGLPRN